MDMISHEWKSVMGNGWERSGWDGKNGIKKQSKSHCITRQHIERWGRKERRRRVIAVDLSIRVEVRINNDLPMSSYRRNQLRSSADPIAPESDEADVRPPQ